MEDEIKILFICQHNSGRSQIAEAYLKQMAGDQFHIQSAGLEPGEGVNPLVVEVMREEGFDLSQKKPQSVFNLFKEGRLFDHVITVCHNGENQCPVFPGIAKRWHCPFPDPAKVDGTHEEKLAQVRDIRDKIKDWLENPEKGSFSFKELLAK